MEQLIQRCEYCGKFIDYVKGRKFCNLRNEGRDCGKKARNKRYYETMGKKQLPKYRMRTRELRDFYKEKGIKK